MQHNVEEHGVRLDDEGCVDDDGIIDSRIGYGFGITEGNGLINGCGDQVLEPEGHLNRNTPVWDVLLMGIRDRIFHGDHGKIHLQTRFWYSNRGYTKSIAAACILLLVFSTVVLMRSGHSRPVIIIDGDFSDWKSVNLVQDRRDDGYPDILTSGIHMDDLKFSIYLETATPILSGFGAQQDIIRLFIDSDADVTTGYSILNIGADHLIEVQGDDGFIISSTYFVFNSMHRAESPRSNQDWNAWSRMFPAEAAGRGNELEIQLWRDELMIPEDKHPVILGHLSGSGDSEDYSPVFTEAGSIEVITRSLLESDTLPVQVEVPILSLQMRSLSTRGLSINSISFMLYSTLYSHEIVSSKLYSDASAAIIDAKLEGGRLFFTTEEDLTDSVVSEWSYTLCMTLTRTVIIGHALNIGLSTITTAAGITPFSLEDARAYAVSPPEDSVVDGLFSEWVCSVPDVTNDTTDPDTDIVSTAVDLGDDDTAIFLEVQGSLFHGEVIPRRSPLLIPVTDRSKDRGMRSIPSSLSFSYLPERTGEDTIIVYLGRDVHENLSSFEDPCISEMVEIKGRSGVVTSSTWYGFDPGGVGGGEWIPCGTPISFSDVNRIELNIPMGGFLYCWIRIISWDGYEDHDGTHDPWSDDPQGVNANSIRSNEEDICINEIFPNPESESQEWVELYNPTGFDSSLEGWKIEDESSVVWTGGENALIKSHATFIIPLNNKLRNSGERISLLDDEDSEVDEVQYPTFSSYEDLSFTRISDGNEYFERDPTPTRDLKNNITDSIKVNEIYYDVTGSEPEGEFIELFNTGSGSRTLDDWILRNDDRVTFDFDAIIDTEDFQSFHYDDQDNDGQSYTDCFGQYGLGGSQDFVVLENKDGQVVDRITYASSSTSDYYDESGDIVGYGESAKDVDEGNSLGRYPDGYDSDDDSSDLVECTITNEEANTPIPESIHYIFPVAMAMFLCFHSGKKKRNSRSKIVNLSHDLG